MLCSLLSSTETSSLSKSSSATPTPAPTTPRLPARAHAPTPTSTSTSTPSWRRILRTVGRDHDRGRSESERGAHRRRERDPLGPGDHRSEEHTSELQSRGHLVCRLLLEKKNKSTTNNE